MINESYLREHSFEDWMKIWMKQCEDNKELKFAEMQLKQVVLHHIAMLWRDKIVELAMSEPMDVVLNAIADRLQNLPTHAVDRLRKGKRANVHRPDP